MLKKDIKKTPLSDTTINALKADIKDYDISDSKINGGVLYLRVTKGGGKQWRLRYKDADTGKHKIKGIGSYPRLTGKQARAKAGEIMQALHNGENINKAKTRLSLKNIADKWVDDEARYKNWTPLNKQKTQERLKLHIYPVFGDRIFTRITAKEWLSFFRQLTQKTNAQGKPINETAQRVRRHIKAIYDYAIGLELTDKNPLTGLDRQLKSTHTPENMAHIGEHEIKNLIDKINQIKTDNFIVYAYFQIIIKTFVRPSELVGAKWQEFDFKNNVWEIPAERMKKRRVHIIPLAPSVINILLELKKYTGISPFLFPSRNDINEPCTAQRFRNHLKKMGYKGKQTLHGFRHIASTKLNEYTDSDGKKFDDRIIEFQLAHKVQGVRGVYNKAQYLQDRRDMMGFYAHWIDSLNT